MNPPELYDAVVIGGGKGGKTLAMHLARQNHKTALIERNALMIGGGCINVACIPTKTFIASARLVHSIRRAAEYGIRVDGVAVDWPVVRKRVESVVSEMRALNLNNFTSLPSLDFILGTGRFLGPQRVEVTQNDGAIRQLNASRIFIDTGTRPAVPDLPGLRDVPFLTSDTIQALEAVPARLLVLGAGYIGLEFAQMMQRFGSQVTVLERGGQILGREDVEVAEVLANCLRHEGVDIQLHAAVEEVRRQSSDGQLVVAYETPKGIRKWTGTHLLVALGRTPVTKDLDLAAAGVETTAEGFVKVNDRLETNVPGIWALGDVSGGPQFTHASLDDFRIVRDNVFGKGARSRCDRYVPSTLFTDPELAHVGLTEKEAVARGLEVQVLRVPITALTVPRAKTTGQMTGLLKATIEKPTQRILGCTLLAAEAGEMIGTVQAVMMAGLPATTLRDAVLSHPTMVEGFNALFAAL
ncbi:MAG: mercuric reductase [Verrucomicrobia bacterium]|nr:mercuric reductase [Verrucomicrobiota bacterium]